MMLSVKVAEPRGGQATTPTKSVGPCSAVGLADPRAWLAAIVESSDDAIISKTLDGTITTWNGGAERMFGYAAAEIVGRPILTLIAADRRDEERDILARLTRGERVDHFDTVRLTKDGRSVAVSVTISPVRDGDGRIVGASKIARDIEGRLRAERDVRAARDAAEEANRAKDRFIGVLSHELRAPLTPTLAAVALLQETPGPPAAEVADLLEMIRRNVEHEARLVDDLLDVTRVTQGKVSLHPEVVDAHAAVRHVVAMLEGQAAAKRLEVSLALHAPQRHIWADPGRFRQVLLNLVGNAVKFTPDGGRVTVRTTDAGTFGRALQVEVSDTGIGIDEATLARLFRPFEQGDRPAVRRAGGLGLGLSIARSLVELHGGRVTARSDGPGRGATFAVRMATVSAARHGTAPAAPAARPRGASSAARRPRVLLVEDHADTRHLLGRLLGSYGCDVTPAGTVAEAKALSGAGDFDLLVSDIGLPDGSGLDVVRHSRERRPTRAIALSGFGRDDDHRRSLDAGFEQHLTKPINFQLLRDVVLSLTT